MNNFDKPTFAVAVLLATTFFGAESAVAKVYSIPGTDAVATVNVPDDWKPSEITHGIEMNSPDSAVYASVEAVKADKISDAVAESVKVLSEQGLVLDQASQRRMT